MNIILNPKYEPSVDKRIKRILADKSNYICIPEEDIAIGEKKQLILTDFPFIFNLNWVDFHKVLSEYKRAVPSSVDRLNLHILLSSDKPVYDGNKNEISPNKLKEIKRVALTNCWEYTSTRFSSGKKGLIVNHNHIIDENGNLRPLYSKPLENCVMENSVFVDLDSFNSQGFPEKKSKIKKYFEGKNILLFSPVDENVAGLFANPGRADLYYNGNPSGSHGCLGVRAKFLEDI
ncbi:hypothetical protein J4446_00640 [Candidatus Woesearchaeota archaeon]|nr:hypothetical protein [Candidatus Woesearchaeota archaeon]